MHFFKADIKSFIRNLYDFNIIIHASKIPTREYHGHYSTISTRKTSTLSTNKITF